jgi:hypothetical protein
MLSHRTDLVAEHLTSLGVGQGPGTQLNQFDHTIFFLNTSQIPRSMLYQVHHWTSAYTFA